MYRKYTVLLFSVISLTILILIYIYTKDDKKMIKDNKTNKEIKDKLCDHIFFKTYLYVILALALIPLIFNIIYDSEFILLFINSKNKYIIYIQLYIIIMLYYLLNKVGIYNQYVLNFIWFMLVFFITLTCTTSIKILLNINDNALLYQLFIGVTIIIISGYYVGNYYSDQLYLFTNKIEYLIFNSLIYIVFIYLYISKYYYEELYNKIIIIFVLIFLLLLMIEYIKALHELNLKILNCKDNKNIKKYINYQALSFDIFLNIGNIIYDIPEKLINMKNKYKYVF